MSGASNHYDGEAGRRYFAYQNQGGLQRGRINARKFAPYTRPQDRVLDFGCASGGMLLHLACAARIGVEVNPIARAEAHRNGIEVYPALEAIPNASVDLIVSNHVLEHVPAPLEALGQLRERLRPGGRLVLVVPIDDWRNQRKVDLQDVNHHLYTWTPLLMGHLLTEAGYTIERVDVLTHAWPPLIWAALDRWLPESAFDAICACVAVLTKRRQILAVAHRPAEV